MRKNGNKDFKSSQRDRVRSIKQESVLLSCKQPWDRRFKVSSKGQIHKVMRIQVFILPIEEATMRANISSPLQGTRLCGSKI